MNLDGKVTNPGELQTQITLETRTVATGDGGFQMPGWSTLAVVWARWTNVHGSEVWAAQSVQAQQPATVLIRYRSGLDTTCAVNKNGVRYEIISIDDIRERHEYLELKVQRMMSG